MAENYNTAPKQNSASNGNSMDLKEILAVIWGFRWWIAISVSICMVIAYCHIRITRVTYTANATVMLVNNSNAGAEAAIMKDLTGVSMNRKTVNEMEIFRSNAVMRRVVEHLGLNYVYTKCRRIKPIIYDINASPFTILYDGVENYPNPISSKMIFIPIDSMSFTFKEIYVNGEKYIFEDRVYNYGEDIGLWGHKISIKPTGVSQFSYGEAYQVSMKPSLMAAKEFSKKLKVTLSNSGKTFDRPDIIYLEFSDFLPRRAEIILDDVISQYNEDSRRFRNQATQNTIEFLNDRLAQVSGELGRIESAYQDYRRSNTLVDMNVQSNLTLNSGQRYETQLDEVNLQLQVIGMVKDYIQHMKPHSTLPANLGIADNGLNSIINQYNALVSERNRMAAASSESNPLVINADTEISEMLSNVRTSVLNLEKSYTVQRQNIEGNLMEGRKRISNIPNQQLAMSGFERQQQIKEPLFILLQQKREEAMISLYSVSDQVKIVDGAADSARPQSNTMRTLLLAVLLGFIIPPGCFFINQSLRMTVEGKSDITSRTSAPVIVTIPVTDTPDRIVRSNGRSSYEEAFRVMRTNFRFFSHKVYQVISSSPHEGKSFVSSNIAASLAYSGKKVLLVGADLRNPRLGQIFKISCHPCGLTSFLIGSIDDIKQIIYKNISDIENLDVIFAGSIPPNPSELVESDRMKMFVDKVREMDYDYILFDSCPYLPVADSISMNRYVDANIMVMRSGITSLKFISEVDEIISSGKLNNVSIVLNGVDITAKTYGYYNGYGYGHYGYGGRRRFRSGYGYGYGFGYGYGAEDDNYKKKSILGMLFKDKKNENVNPEYSSSSDEVNNS